MVVLICHFSVSQSPKQIENLQTVLARLKAAAVPHYVAELLIGDQAQSIRAADFVFRCNSVMFHKEALWNLMAERVPAQFSKLVFTDADILFSAHDWLDQCSALLDTVDVAQPMDTCQWVGFSRGNKPSIASALILRNDPAINIAKYHPGFALAVRRDWLEKVGGFYDRSLLGNGDIILWWVFMCSLGFDASVAGRSRLSGYSLVQYYDLLVDVEHFLANVLKHPPRIGCLHGVTTYHLPHGSFEKRQYLSRLDNFTADELRAITKNKQGIYEWASEAPHKKAETYLLSRQEDGPHAEKLAQICRSLDPAAVPLCCINLARANERREYMQQEWQQKRNVPLTFFDAFDKQNNLVAEDGTDGGVLPYTDNAALAQIWRCLSQGERATRLSYFMCAQHLLRTYPDAPFYVICEDDAEPLFDTHEELIYRIARGLFEYDDTDALLCHDVWGRFEIESFGLFNARFKLTPKNRGPFGCVCAAYTKSGLEKYCTALEQNICPADGWRFWAPANNFHLSCLINNVARHQNATTYIGNEFRNTRRDVR